MSNRQSTKKLSSLKRRRSQSLAKQHCLGANDESATLVQKLSKLFDKDQENTGDNEVQKESSKQQVSDHVTPNSKVSGNGERKPFGDITQLRQSQDRCNPISKEHSSEKKNKLAELEYSVPQKQLQTQVFEKREQMLQMQTKVELMYEELMSADNDKMGVKTVQEKYEKYIKCRKELIEISSAFELLQEQCINVMYQKVVAHSSDPTTCFNQPAHYTHGDTSQESHNPTCNDACTKGENNILLTASGTSAVAANDSKGNQELISTSGVIGIELATIGSEKSKIKDCCYPGLLVTDESISCDDANCALQSQPQLSINPIESKSIGEKGCNDPNEKEEQLQDEKEKEEKSRVCEQTSATPLTQSNDIPSTVGTDNSTKACEIVASDCGAQESTNAIMNKLQPTTNTMEKSCDEETMTFDQTAASPGKENEPLTIRNRTNLQKFSQPRFKKPKSMDKWQTAKDRIQKSSSPLTSRSINNTKCSIEKLSFSNLKKLDKDSNTPATGRSLSFSRKSSGRWSNRSHTPLERQDTPVVQKSHGKYFRPGPCEVTLPSIGEHRPSASNLTSPSARPKASVGSETKSNGRKIPAKKLAESLSSTKSTPRDVIYGKRKAGYSSVKSKIDSGLKRLPGKKPLKLQELQSPIANDGDSSQSQPSSPMKPVKRALSCIADDEPASPEEHKRRRTVDDENSKVNF